MMRTDTTRELQGFSYEDRQDVLPGLTAAMTEAGGWVLERRSTSATVVQFRVEIQLRGIVELYAGLMAMGVELTKATHTMLTELCLCRRYAGWTEWSGEVITLKLEVSFLEELTLSSLLNVGAAAA